MDPPYKDPDPDILKLSGYLIRLRPSQYSKPMYNIVYYIFEINISKLAMFS